jgi:2-methylcitrate dehydratase PrpD
MTVVERVTATRLLAEFAESVAFGDLTEGALLRTREHLADTLGVGVAAAVEEPAMVLTAFLAELGPQERGATVLGARVRTTPWDAAWANGTLCHLLDFDDYGFGHPGACVVPAALAAGEIARADGETLLLALAVGWEVFDRISRACRRHERVMRGRGIHPTSVYGAPAAAATAGKLLGLDAEQLTVALGLAASASGGIIEQFGTWGKGVQAGNAARAGVTAALLAARGYGGTTTALEGEHGLLNAFAGEGNYDLDLLTAALGESWAIETPGFSLKPYPACGGTMRGIEAAIALRSSAAPDPWQIERVDVEASESILDSLHVDRPTRGFEGKFSLRYCVACALADGDVTIDSFSDASLARPIVQQLLDRTVLTVRPGGYTPGPEVYRTPISVRLADGTTATEQVDLPRGHRDRRLTAEEVAAKFVDCLRRADERADVERAVAVVDRLEQHTVEELIAALP